MIKRSILLAVYDMSINTWNKSMETFSECNIQRIGRVIKFEGSEEDFDKFHDRLISDESRTKVIGIYN